MTRINRPGGARATKKLPDHDTLVKKVKKQAGGLTPAAVFSRSDPREVSPANAVVGAFPGYQWDAAVLDEVMHKYGIGDTRAVLRTAIALDAGDRYLTKDELAAAAKQQAGYRKQGYRWSPGVLADVMSQRGVAAEGALLRAAEGLDDGNKYLSRAELERAADVLTSVVEPNDVAEIVKRARETATQSNFELTHLGDAAGGLPIIAVKVPAKKQPPRLRVVITGGVHGDEPCGAAAAALLLEQVAGDERLRDDVEWTIIPVVNPRGLAQGTRRTPEDMDLNRNMVTVPKVPPEVELMREFMEGKEFDLALDLHSGGSKRNGFWVLHKDSDAIATAAMASFDERWPTLNGDTKPYTLSSPGVGESGSSETLKDLAKVEGARWAMTVEAPGSVGYLDQVLGESEIVHSVVNAARVVLATEEEAA